MVLSSSEIQGQINSTLNLINDLTRRIQENVNCQRARGRGCTDAQANALRSQKADAELLIPQLKAQVALAQIAEANRVEIQADQAPLLSQIFNPEVNPQEREAAQPETKTTINPLIIIGGVALALII